MYIMNNKNYIIEAKHISKKYGNRTILEDISFRFQSGHAYGIVGGNGSGKTVLLKCICGFVKSDGGNILINGKRLEKKVLLGAGIMIESPGFLENWNAYNNLEFLYSIRNRKKDKEHLCTVLKKVGLNPKSRMQVGKYSLGMKQRLALAQAIMEEPDVLILDEPMNNLDNDTAEKMRELFCKMKTEGKLIILSSHIQKDIDSICDEVFELESGKLNRIC